MIKKLLYENGELSLTRVLAVASYLFFVVGTTYLLVKGMQWAHYSEFATLTGGGGLATQVANKLCNSKYNSNDGQFPNRGGVAGETGNTGRHPDNG